MTKTNKQPAETSAPEVTPAADAPSAAPAQDTAALVTVNDLVLIVKFLEELANMKRLSEFEIQGVKPSFDRIVAFLNAHQQTQNAETAANSPVTQTEETLLDLPAKGNSKKKSSKKK